MNFQLNFVSVPTPCSTPTTPTTISTTHSPLSTTTPPINNNSNGNTCNSTTSSCSSPLMSTQMSCLSSTSTTTTTLSSAASSLPPLCTTTITTTSSLLDANNIHNNNTSSSTTTLDGDNTTNNTLNMISKTCAGCSQAIVDRYYLVFDDRHWHSRCLTCIECGVGLERRCFFRNGLTYCKGDYLRLFSFRTCAKCCQIIEPHQLVMRVNSGQYFFHIDCFTCSQCYCILHKNDYYGLIDGKIYCSDHYSLLLRESALSSLTISSNNNNTSNSCSSSNNNNNNNNINSNSINGANSINLNHNLNSNNNHRGPSSLSSASPVSSLSSPSSSSLSTNYQQQQQQSRHLHPLVPHHLAPHHHHQHQHPHQQPLHLLQQNILNSSPNPMSPISNHLHHLSNNTTNNQNSFNSHLNHHPLLNDIKPESLFNSSIGDKSSAEPVVQVRQTTRGRPKRKLKKEPLECNSNNNNNVNSSDNLSHSIENQHQLPSHLLHPPHSTSTPSSTSSSSHNDNIFHDHPHALGCPVDSLPGNLHETHLGLTRSPSSCPLSGLNGQSTNSNHGPMGGGGGNTTNGGGSSNGSSSSKSKRVRTSFKHAQLKTMKSYFALNQNPDAKDLKGLATKTGLSKRVLQVWFQNARAKWRKTSVNVSKSLESVESSIELQVNQSADCDEFDSDLNLYPNQH